ncbi:MAG: hypothetical protein R3F59_22555 [Myxococcota bacterium]
MLAEDVFRALDRFRRTGRTFDRIVLDPPAFSKGERTFSAKQDYPRLVAAAARVTDDGGWLVAASNQGELSPRAFDGLVADGPQEGRRGRAARPRRHSGGRLPAATWFPEGRYLKVRVLRILR